MTLRGHRLGIYLFSLMIVGCAGPSTMPEKNLTIDPESIDIPFTKKVLDNGLTVIVHEDHKTPIVNVTVWYHVGSKNERPGITGFAHLFEHLMFNGSENFDDDYFRPFEQVGATGMNGTTSRDRTNYFQSVPSPAVDLALWMESDRMGHLLGAIDQDKLEEQRSVVKNEKRQRESSPYGQVWELLATNTYPSGHPYSWTTIGSMDDLNAASLDDVREWFETYYGAANAVLVIAGDIDTETAFEKARYYFGDIPAGPPIVHPGRNIAPLDTHRRMVIEDRVAQPRIYITWNVPEWGSRDVSYLALGARILGGGRTSRLYRRLVEEAQVATEVSVSVGAAEIGSQLYAVASVRDGVALERVEALIQDEFARFLAEGPTADELERARMGIVSGFLRGIEHVGGFGGKAQVLAESEVFGGRPDAWRDELETLLSATPDDLIRAMDRWVGDGRFTLAVKPFPEYATEVSTADRSQLPDTGTPPDLDFPPLARATLSNGMSVVLARRPDTPVVEFRMLLDAGYAADPSEQPGLSSLTMAMLDEGTSRLSAQAFAAEKERLGASIWAGAGLDSAVVGLSALRDTVAPSLDLYAEMVRDPAFPEKELELLKRRRLAAIAQEKTQPSSLAMRLLPPLLYGADHPYGQPLTGTGREETVATVDVEDLRTFYERHVHPGHATLIVVGDVAMAELVPQLERVFGDWGEPAQAPIEVDVPGRVRPEAEKLYLVDRPDYEQSMIFAGQIMPPTGYEGDIALETANTLFGGMFTSRLNMNLREDKGWAYGAGANLPNAKGQRPWMIWAPVQRDKTAEAIGEMRAELAGIVGSKPIQGDELTKAQNNLTLKLPGQHETAGQVASSVESLIRYGLADDYYDHFVSQVRGLQPDEVQAEASRQIEVDRLIWVVVGDLARIEDEVRALGFEAVEVIDVDGRPVR
ncbi:MAG: pitrilysin family protein [Pseudomonadota bacterium]|nr:pitrilysin family protein [Pseudomonadota bacterium]